MSEVVVDTEKLAYGLERGIGHSDTIFSAAPIEFRLRCSPCGLVSSAINAYARRRDIPIQLMINSPNLAFDPEMQHVLPFLGEPSQELLVIDASFSLFLGYVGLGWGYETATGTKAFPPEKIIEFKLSERDIVIDWLTTVAVEFQKRNCRPKTDDGYDLGSGPLAIATPGVIKSVYSQIYGSQNYVPWTPPDYVLKHGETVSKYIPRSSITIS
ncbi:hypothetical protein A3J32_02045 [Candidatus Saccharibacteria bacterium RIFCSPLOWO2_02_FULL_46_7]|nr:MAG: hypothetical protein A3J32_02045 [Candidatus Saccharibacteria bacterium RIFCSPLOWO2_02_FULL_46_7]